MSASDQSGLHCRNLTKSYGGRPVLKAVDLASGKLAILPGDQGYKDYKLPLGDGIPIGLFLADIVNFLILAAALFFFIVKFLGWLMKTKAAADAPAPEPSAEEKLLTEIRDLLKAR